MSIFQSNIISKIVANSSRNFSSARYQENVKNPSARNGFPRSVLMIMTPYEQIAPQRKLLEIRDVNLNIPTQALQTDQHSIALQNTPKKKGWNLLDLLKMKRNYHSKCDSEIKSRPVKPLRFCENSNNVYEEIPQGATRRKSCRSNDSKFLEETAKTLSVRVAKIKKKALGPGGVKMGTYKNQEYFCYDKYSFLDAHSDLSSYRMPQPSSIQKPKPQNITC